MVHGDWFPRKWILFLAATFFYSGVLHLPDMAGRGNHDGLNIISLTKVRLSCPVKTLIKTLCLFKAIRHAS